ncbi:MAG TPA: site-2 protease family protein, partial [Propionibacteriaceae bacterium]|nr:site-2 protease family protein [Propionibacteriaceae bacterium]
MTGVWAVLTGIGFFALIMASIALHEVGHLVPAKLFGVKVPQYFVGFGKRIWSVRRGETEYGIKWLPLGGYVRLVGMYPPGRPGRRGRLAELADSAREAERDDITDTDIRTNRLFYQKRTWQKLVIMAGGPLMNVLLAFLIFLGVNLAYGQQQQTLTVAVVSDCLDPAPAACVAPPAKQAGLKAGDTVVALNGQTVSTWRQLVTLVRAEGAGEIAFTVERPGQGRVTLPTVHGVLRQVVDLNDPSKTVTAGFAGMSSQVTTVRVGPVGTLKDMWTLTTQSVAALGTFPQKVFATGYDLVTGKPRDAAGPLSVVGVSVAASEIATTERFTLGSRIASYFSLLGSVNLFVAILNLVPLLPFDGG